MSRESSELALEGLSQNEHGALGVRAPFKKIYSALALCFVLLAVTVPLLLGLILTRDGLNLNTDLRALLPGGAEHGLEQAAADRLVALGGNNIVLMVAGKNPADIKNSVLAIDRILGGSKYLRTNKRALDDSQFSPFVERLSEYRFSLLGDQQRELLRSESYDRLAAQALYDLYNPSGWARMVPPAADPLNLFGGWFTGLRLAPGNLRLEEGFLFSDSADSSGRYYGVMLVELLIDPFSLSGQSQAVSEVDGAFASLPAGISVYRSGVLFHAAEAAGRARKEVSIISLGSVVGIVLLYLISFRSLRPLLLSLCAILFGSVSAFSVVHAMFGGLHLITLVFGAGLIGVAVDYALHFLSRLYHYGGHRGEVISPWRALSSVFSGIALGLLTTVIGYLCLIQSSMPGLYQIALFSVVGLIAAWLFVVVLFPILFRAQVGSGNRFLTATSLVSLKFWRVVGKRNAVYLLGLLLLVSVAVCVNSLHFSKDVRTLHLPSASLLSEAQEVQRVLGAFAPNQFFVVYAENEQRVLEAEEAFQSQLNGLVATGAIASFDKVSNYLPSISRQHDNYRLLDAAAYGDSSNVNSFKSNTFNVGAFMAEAGVSEQGVAKHLADFSDSDGRYLSLSQWQAVAPEKLQSQWLGEIDGYQASVITLVGVADSAALRRSAEGAEQILFVDRVEDISQGLLEHSNQAVRFLLAAYGVIALLLVARYRQLSALLLVSIPLLSSLLVVALLSALGVAISLFHLFGLFLVLGLGMDYGIFIRESQQRSCWIAITLSAITSCLSFGLMSLSSTPMVSAFGATVLVGSLCNLFLVPVVGVMADQVEVANG